MALGHRGGGKRTQVEGRLPVRLLYRHAPNEVLTLRWECVDHEAMVFRVADRIEQLMRTPETQTP